AFVGAFLSVNLKLRQSRPPSVEALNAMLRNARILCLIQSLPARVHRKSGGKNNGGIHMKMVLVLLLLSLGNFTQALAKATAPSALQEITKPTGVKVRAAFKAWESYLNPNMCYPDSFAFKMT